jgi:hypothetical protein
VRNGWSSITVCLRLRIIKVYAVCIADTGDEVKSHAGNPVMTSGSRLTADTLVGNQLMPKTRSDERTQGRKCLTEITQFASSPWHEAEYRVRHLDEKTL